MQGQEGLAVLDLAGITQANVGFVTALGHRLYSEDFLRSFSVSFGDAATEGGQLDPRSIDAFFRENLAFPDHFFDAVFVWDILEFLPQPLLKATVDRLFHIVKPGSYLLAFFHAEEKATEVLSYSYRIADSATLLLASRGTRRPSQLFNNRGIEKLFERFQSVKFFLARDHLREVIVAR